MLTVCAPPTAVPVTGFAQAFLGDKLLANAHITWLETQQQLRTDSAGKFSFCALPGQSITLRLTKLGYAPLQTGTTRVPTLGMTTPYTNITFQAPSVATYALLKLLITKERHITVNTNDCQVVTTITKYHKTLKDDPQGMPGATVTLTHNGQSVTPDVRPFYFGMFKNGKTNPFSNNLTATSLDGGAIIMNLAPSTIPYTITANEKGYAFTSARFICNKGQLINISPPLAPSVKGVKVIL
ncbi:MAG: hypothetical protein COB66_00765 [Coxiella sp. (in: Bacteria)]|nr:MAG: hypothetical protein COB66_00765 [Coxiella sp. (in: g-proteobacteria)]